MRKDAATTRQRCLELAAEGKGPKAIAETLGIADRTVRGHLNHPEVAAELRQLQDERLTALMRRALDGADVALGVLRAVAEDARQPGGSRVQAARVMLENAVRLLEVTSMAERLDRVESWINVLTEDDAGASPERRGRWRARA